MSTIKVTEIFSASQGEGYWAGQPSVFLRTFGCNFRCPSFGLEPGWKTTEPQKVLEEFKLHPEWTLDDLPLVNTGCDSYAAIYPGFKDLSPKMHVDMIVDEMESARLASKKIVNGPLRNNGNTHLVVTGGEPLLGWQKAYPDLFTAAFAKGYQHITIETNGTQKIIDKFAAFLLLSQATVTKSKSLTFSVSPKLSCSGEVMEKALQPDIVAAYQKFGMVYLKFVVSKEADLREVNLFVKAYRKAGFRGEVYLMPVGGKVEMYNLNAATVNEMAIAYDYRYSPRLQIDLYGNSWGT